MSYISLAITLLFFAGHSEGLNLLRALDDKALHGQETNHRKVRSMTVRATEVEYD